MNRLEVSADGKTAYARNKGKGAEVQGLEIGEKVFWKYPSRLWIVHRRAGEEQRVDHRRCGNPRHQVRAGRPEGAGRAEVVGE
eukprot:8583628-Lingulodinium_polyedra.AAC.1